MRFGPFHQLAHNLGYFPKQRHGNGHRAIHDASDIQIGGW